MKEVVIMASKEQDEQEVQETVEQTEVEETAEIETAKPETVVQETMEAVEGIMTDKEAYEIIGNRAKELIQNVEVQQKMVEIAKTKSKDEAEKWLYMTAVATLCCCGKSNC